MFVLNFPADNSSPIAYTLCRLPLQPGPWEILQEMGLLSWAVEGRPAEDSEEVMLWTGSAV